MQKTNHNNKTYYLFDTLEEFIEHVNKLKITRTINKLQVHHTYAPSYSNWKTDIELRRVRNTVDYHKQVFGSNDIAQHYTIFPNGKIATGRDINSTPIGIKGWNTNAICCEIYGNFDVDTMTKEQKETVIAFYGTWCKKLKLKASVDTIRPHCWFTSSGIYLGDYSSSKSAKTCPGKKFFGGNSKKSMKDNFIPLIQNFIDGKTSNTTTSTSITTTKWKNGSYNCKVKATANLNLRSGRGTNFDIIYTIPKGTTFNLGYVNDNWGSTWDFKSKVGYLCCDYIEKV